MKVSNRLREGEDVVPPAGRVVALPAESGLLQRLRDGQDDAFGELFELHVGAVRRLARGMATNSSEAEDITAETFFRVLQALRRGAGPRDNVRAYLLTVARRVCWEWQSARREVPVPDDELTTRIGAGGDRHATAAEQALIGRAFASLPERWRVVLWQTEVEGVQPAVVAPHFGLSANATSALARRARLGLRAAYLQAHLADGRGAEPCRGVLEKLGGYTAGNVTGSQARKMRIHLRRCPSCRATHRELREVCSSLRTQAGALVVLVPSAAVAFATGSGSAGTAGSAAGTAALALGTKLKVGAAIASTAAAGAIAAGPIVFDLDRSQPIGLPGQGEVELSRASTPPTSEIIGTPRTPPGVQGRSGAGVPVAGQRQQGATEYGIPRQRQLGSQADNRAPGQQEPGRRIGSQQQDGAPEARIDRGPGGEHPEGTELPDTLTRTTPPEPTSPETTSPEATSPETPQPTTPPSGESGTSAPPTSSGTSGNISETSSNTGSSSSTSGGSTTPG